MSQISVLRPLGDRIIAKRDESENRTPGGIVIPENAKKDSCLGTVVAVGPGKTTESGSVLPMSVKAGDHIAFSKYGATEMTFNGESLLILHEGEILAVLDAGSDATPEAPSAPDAPAPDAPAPSTSN